MRLAQLGIKWAPALGDSIEVSGETKLFTKSLLNPLAKEVFSGSDHCFTCCLRHPVGDGNWYSVLVVTRIYQPIVELACILQPFDQRSTGRTATI